MRQIPLPFSGLLGENMALESVLALDFARAGQLEPFFRCAVGFYFWHIDVLNLTLFFLHLHLGREYDAHPFALQLGELIHLAVVLELLGKLEEQNLTALLENDRPADEMHISFHLGTVFQEVDGMFKFEVKVVIVGVGPEADFLHHRLLGFGLDFLLLFLLLVLKLRIIDHLAYRRIRIGRYFHQIEP